MRSAASLAAGAAQDRRRLGAQGAEGKDYRRAEAADTAYITGR
jgi:hypothetical protein